MSIAKQIFYNISTWFPMGFLKTISPSTTLMPYHHTVSDQHLPHIAHLYAYKNVEQFTKDLELLLTHYEPITPEDLIEYTNIHNKLPAGKFLLSFDDGFKEVYEIVAPILKSRGVPAIFFINPAFINNTSMFYRNKISLLIEEFKNHQEDQKIVRAYAEILNSSGNGSNHILTKLKSIRTETDLIDQLAAITDFSFEEWLKKHQPYLSSSQLMELKNQGFTIGAHSWDHPYYSRLTLQDQIKQTVDSCDYVQEHELSTKRYFSFPHFDAGLSQQTLNMLRKETTALFGTQNQKLEIYNHVYHRFNAERPVPEFSKQLKGLLLYMTIQKILGKHKVARL